MITDWNLAACSAYPTLFLSEQRVTCVLQVYVIYIYMRTYTQQLINYLSANHLMEQSCV